MDYREEFTRETGRYAAFARLHGNPSPRWQYVEWLEKRLQAAESPATVRAGAPGNTGSLKLPGRYIVETHVLGLHEGCSINERERIAGVVHQVYDYMAEQLRAGA